MFCSFWASSVNWAIFAATSSNEICVLLGRRATRCQADFSSSTLLVPTTPWRWEHGCASPSPRRRSPVSSLQALEHYKWPNGLAENTEDSRRYIYTPEITPLKIYTSAVVRWQRRSTKVPTEMENDSLSFLRQHRRSMRGLRFVMTFVMSLNRRSPLEMGHRMPTAPLFRYPVVNFPRHR